MAHLAALPLLEYVAGEVALPLFASAAAGTLTGGLKRLRREGVFEGASLMKRRMTLPMGGRTPKKGRYTPRRGGLFPAAVSTPTRASRYRAQLGRPIRRFSKRVHTSFGVRKSNLPDKTLHWDRLISIPWSEDETQINRRRSNLVNVQGIRVRYQFKIKDTLAVDEVGLRQPLLVRWAIINPKDNDGSDKSADQPNDWFISRDPGEQMDLPMNTNHRYFTYAQSPINKMKYGVVKEGKFLLSAVQTRDNAADFKTASSKTVAFNIPIKKQMKFDVNANDPGDDRPETNLYMVYWYTRYNEFNSGVTFNATATRSVPIETLHETSMYFTNGKLYA